MAKATHNGTCQACGRKQAYRGTIAKHGYTTKYGFFMGTCSGSDRQPLELNTDHNVATVAAIRDWADQQDQLSHGNIETVTVSRRVKNDRYFRREDVQMNREEFVAAKMTKYAHRSDEDKISLAGYCNDDFDKAVQRVRENMRRNAASARIDAEKLDALRDKTFGNELEARFVEDAPKSHRESFSASKDENGRVDRANAKAYDRQRELKAEGIRSRVTGDARYATITYKK